MIGLQSCLMGTVILYVAELILGDHLLRKIHLMVSFDFIDFIYNLVTPYREVLFPAE